MDCGGKRSATPLFERPEARVPAEPVRAAESGAALRLSPQSKSSAAGVATEVTRWMRAGLPRRVRLLTSAATTARTGFENASQLSLMHRKCFVTKARFESQRAMKPERIEYRWPPDVWRPPVRKERQTLRLRLPKCATAVADGERLSPCRCHGRDDGSLRQSRRRNCTSSRANRRGSR